MRFITDPRFLIGVVVGAALVAGAWGLTASKTPPQQHTPVAYTNVATPAPKVRPAPPVNERNGPVYNGKTY